ncbi:MAG: glycosyltransferase [Acidimicrobiia bacterium]|nr:glycosyltransferase [Acidimicrobiia bacterium]
MQIALVQPSPVPYTYGGAERLLDGLWAAARDAGHEVEVVKLPSPERTLPEIVASYESFAHLDLTHFDAVVSTKYPAWMVEHPNHVIWLLHRLRGLYDTYHLAGLADHVECADPDLRSLQRMMRSGATRMLLPRFFDAFHTILARRGADDPVFAFPGPLAREIVHWLDTIGFDPLGVTRYTAISATVADRAGYMPAGIRAAVAYPPSQLAGLRSGGQDHFFTASRLDGPKRIDLLVEAMRDVDSDLPFLIAGTGPDEERLRRLASGDERIRFLGRVTDGELAGLYANALAVPFVPAEEDFGLVTLEAFACSTPVVTCIDSGGPTELVDDGLSGLVTDPTPAALAAALSRLAADPAGAAAMGTAGHERGRRVTWERVLSTLLGREALAARPSAPRPSPRRGYPKVVVPSTFRIWPPAGGGQIRCLSLYGGMLESFDVEVVSMDNPHAPATRVVYGPGFVESVVPRTWRHEELDVEWSERAGIPVTDIMAAELVAETPAYRQALADALADADHVVLAHPYLEPLVHALAPSGVPVVYDAHNAELRLKAEILPNGPVRDELLDRVRRIEGDAVSRSALTTTTSGLDADHLVADYGADPARIRVVPNGVDTRAIHFVTGDDRRRRGERWLTRFPSGSAAHLAVFLGSWHKPNLDAAQDIIEAAAEVPDTMFLLVGSHGLHFRGRALPGNVLLAGTVDPIVKNGILSAADVGLNPMQSGSGTNLKILEYFAAGVPVLATGIGARGIPAEPGVHYRRVEGDLAGSIRAFLEDPDRDRTVEAARRLVEESFDWRILGRRLAALIKRIDHAGVGTVAEGAA